SGMPTPSSMPHGSVVYQQRCVPLPALRHHTAYGRHPAPLLPRPQFRACAAASTPERCCAPSGSPSRPIQRRTRQPCNPLSEEKAIRSLRIDIVTEKNQTKWKLLTGKNGRLNWIHPAPTLREDGLHMQALPQLRPYTSAVDRADVATRARCDR